MHFICRKKSISKFYKAIILDPNYPNFYYNLAIAQNKLNALEKAIISYGKVLRIEPDHIKGRKNLANVFYRNHRYKEALFHFDLADGAAAKSQSLECLYALERYDEMESRLQVISDLDTSNIRVAAFSAFVSHQLKKADPYPFCKNPLDFFHLSNLSDHAIDIDNFITNIINEAEDDNLVWEPDNKTTRLGYQTENTIFQAGKYCSLLEKIISNEIKSYYTEFASSDCLYMTSWPANYNLSGWFVRLIKDGHQEAHIHPDGWLSGVVYLKTLPTDSSEGAIELSLHGYDFPVIDNDYPRKIHHPNKGDIILFPSSLFHRTIPFKTDTDRCVIAFDLVPTTQNR